MKKRGFVLLENFLGRVDNLLFYRRNRRRYVRKIRSNVKKRAVSTSRQLLGQARFAYVVALYRAIKGTFLHEIWRLSPRAEGTTGYHNFIRSNYAAFGLEGMILDYSRLKISVGNLRLPLGIYVEAVSGREIVIMWDTGWGELQGDEADRLYVFLMYGDDSFRFTFFDRLDACRGEGYASIELSAKEVDPVHLYYFFGSMDLLDFSDSGYCCLK